LGISWHALDDIRISCKQCGIHLDNGIIEEVTGSMLTMPHRSGVQVISMDTKKDPLVIIISWAFFHARVQI